ncbi:dermonecrotic toxin domain-containing protein [Pseudomonas sp. R11F]|uniref:dermonecrotic toxin domain-containing protein n=1 Tax=Pseudomonas TaxID=286 RepID=UPI00398EB2CD
MQVSLNTPHLALIPPISRPPTAQASAQPAVAQAPASVHPDETALLAAYLAAVQRKVLQQKVGLVTVSPQTTLGQWLQDYRNQLEHPVVSGWMRDQNIDIASVSINPATGALSAEVEGVRKTFLPRDNSGWGQVSGPLLAAAKVICPVPGSSLQLTVDGETLKVKVKLIAEFYGKYLPKNGTEARAQIRRLEHNKAFDPIAPNDPLRPAASRSAQALGVHKQHAAQYYASAPQALAFKRLAVDVANNLPNTRAQAKLWAETLIFQLTGKQVDADTIYLNRFKTANTPLSAETATATGWEHPGEEPYSSLRLPDALLENFSEHDGVPGSLDQEAGLYLAGPGQSAKGGYGAHNQFPLAPSALMHASWKTDFQAGMTQKIDNFWSAHTGDYETAIRGEFAYQARKQLKAAQTWPPAERTLQAPEHRFTREDYRLVMGAVPNLPSDENAPLSVEQLKTKATANGRVQAHALNIHGFMSSDILRFSADGGRQVLYIPGAQPAFLRFDSLEKLNQWVTEQTRDPKKREALVAHFPLIYRQDHAAGFAEKAATTLMPILWFSHVGDKKEGLDTIFEKMATGTLKGPAINNGHSPIEGDVFSTLATAAKERMTGDADVMIKSNSEVNRDTWLNDITVAASLLAKLAPIAAPVAALAAVTGLAEGVLGTEKALSGDTEAERNDGASKAFDGLLNVLFSVGASGSVEDPFLPPEDQPIAPAPGEAPVVESLQPRVPVNRLQPSQAGNISEHAVANGEQLIENATRNAKGIYQVKDQVSGLDHWFIRYTDTTGVGRVYEVRGDFKLSHDYVQIINRETGKPVMTVHATADGEWARGLGPGGKWPWNKPSAPPGKEAKPLSKVSDAFVDLEGRKLEGAEQIDEYLKMDDNMAYEYSIRNVEENGVIKSKIGISWDLAEDDFQIYASEAAGPSDFSSSEYSEQFTKDLARFNYSVVVKNGLTDTRTVLTSTAQDGLENTAEKLRQFEALIPNPKLRARISEVAHQGSLAPSTKYLNDEATGLYSGFYLGGKDTEIIIEYDAVTRQAKVNFVGKSTISQPETERYKIPEVEIITKRTLTISESNETQDAANVYVIDKKAPSNIEFTLVLK